MSSNTIVQNIKKYVSGSHRFINVGTGSTSVPTDTLVTLGKSTIMTIENGNVGVGTTSPLYKLHLEGNSYLNGDVSTNNNNINAGTGTITASGLAGSVITNSTSTTSSSITASATAVKSAYDLASAALPKTGGTVNGDVFISGNLTASNLTVIGDTTVLNTVSSNTEQMVITNAGTGPALKVTQTGDNSVAEFYDNESGIALFVGNNGNVGVGTTVPQSKLDVAGILKATGLQINDITNAFMPRGGIIMWSGSIATIPTGWAICDGTNGTPDLRNRFVIGAGNTYAVAATAGSTTKTLAEANMPAHTHSGTTDGTNNYDPRVSTASYGSYTAGYPDCLLYGKFPYGSASMSHTHTFTTDSKGSGTAFDIMPPYYALAYIMKL